jgi:hypothetical protein
MRKPLYDKKVLRERGLVTNGFYLPYNPKLTARANELRKNVTPMVYKLNNNSSYCIPNHYMLYFSYYSN